MDRGEVVNNLYPALCGICEELYVGRGGKFVHFNPTVSVVSYSFIYVDRDEKIVGDFFRESFLFCFLYRAMYIDRSEKIVSDFFPTLLSTVSVQSWFLYRRILDRGEKIVIDIRLSGVSVQRRKDWSVLIRLSL